MQLYHKAFGVKQRKVPAHMPHMINSDVVSEMQRLWPEEWERTSRNRFRSGNDMQYGFSYFYYLSYRRELRLGLNKVRSGSRERSDDISVQRSSWGSSIADTSIRNIAILNSAAVSNAHQYTPPFVFSPRSSAGG